MAAQGIQAISRHLGGTKFFEQGTGPTVVLVHGSLCDARIWEPQRENIANAHRYVAVNLRYHGSEPWPDEGEGYSLLHHTAQVAEFIQGLAEGPVHLVGQSYGGHIATRVAMDSPQLVRSLTLQEPAIQSLVEGPEAEAIAQERQQAFGPAVTAVKQGQVELGARMFVEALLNEGPGSVDAVPDYLQAMLKENARTLPLLLMSPPPPPISCSQLQQLRVPTLIINGERTQRFYSFVGEKMASCIPGAQRHVVPNASHGVETQNASGYWQVLGAFLAAC